MATALGVPMLKNNYPPLPYMIEVSLEYFGIVMGRLVQS